MEKKEKISEKLLERLLTQQVKEVGGLCFKFTSPNITGVPDRIILFCGALVFAEIKTTGKKLTPRQKVLKNEIEKQGFKYFVIDSRESLQECLKTLTALC